MSLKSEIRHFLDDVDPKILARGEDYFPPYCPIFLEIHPVFLQKMCLTGEKIPLHCAYFHYSNGA